MAGAGVKAGEVYGTTTKDGKSAADNVLKYRISMPPLLGSAGIDPACEEKSAVVDHSRWRIAGSSQRAVHETSDHYADGFVSMRNRIACCVPQEVVNSRLGLP